LVKAGLGFIVSWLVTVISNGPRAGYPGTFFVFLSDMNAYSLELTIDAADKAAKVFRAVKQFDSQRDCPTASSYAAV